MRGFKEGKDPASQKEFQLKNKTPLLTVKSQFKLEC